MNRARKWSLLWLLVLPLVSLAVSCSEDVDVTKQRRVTNERQFDSFSDSTDYQKVSSPGLYGDNYVYMHWIARGAEDAPRPKATSLVNVLYKAYYLNQWVGQENPQFFDTNTNRDKRDPLSLSTTVRGFTIALENMRVGDEVGVAIPWHLAYGASGLQNSLSQIPSYVALYYWVKLESIEDQE